MRSLAFAAVMLAGCATSAPAEVTSPRQLSENAAAFDGQDVTVRGYLLLGTNGRSLFQSAQRFREWERAFHSGEGAPDFEAFNLDGLTLLNADELLANADRLAYRTVTLHGRLVKDYYKDRNIFDSHCWCGNPAAFVIDDASVSAILKKVGR
jgi:hypothetical protein